MYITKTKLYCYCLHVNYPCVNQSCKINLEVCMEYTSICLISRYITKFTFSVAYFRFPVIVRLCRSHYLQFNLLKNFYACQTQIKCDILLTNCCTEIGNPCGCCVVSFTLNCLSFMEFLENCLPS